MTFMLERGRVPVPFGPGGKVQPGLLWSPQPWGRSSGNWGLFWMEGKAPRQCRSRMDKRTKQAGGGRWWPLRDRAGFHLGEWVRLWGDFLGGGGRRGQSEELEWIFRGVCSGFALWSRAGSPAGSRAGRRSHPRSELLPCLEHSQGNTWELFISVRACVRSSTEGIDSSSPVLSRPWIGGASEIDQSLAVLSLS